MGDSSNVLVKKGKIVFLFILTSLIFISPLRGVSSPEINFNRLVFPTPFCPYIICNPGPQKVKERLFNKFNLFALLSCFVLFIYEDILL